jgi:hypothetical protein
MVVRAVLGLAALAAAACASGCGGGPTAAWVASEVYVVDDSLSCMTATDPSGARTLEVCRDTDGRVTCRLGDGDAPAGSDGDCRAAERAVRAWETSAGS